MININHRFSSPTHVNLTVASLWRCEILPECRFSKINIFCIIRKISEKINIRFGENSISQCKYKLHTIWLRFSFVQCSWFTLCWFMQHLKSQKKRICKKAYLLNRIEKKNRKTYLHNFIIDVSFNSIAFYELFTGTYFRWWCIALQYILHIGRGRL